MAALSVLITPEREPVIGACTLAILALVLGTAYGGSRHGQVPGYDLVARFNKAEGIGVGSDVRLAGVEVGKVVGQTLDDRYRAVLTIRVAPDLKLPDDSAALIQTDGLLGGKFVALQPGGEETDMKPGEEFHYTQDSVNVRDLLELIVDQGKARRAANDGAAAGAKSAPSP